MLWTGTSETFVASSGVSQGSILGPLFFNVFITGIRDRLTARSLLYADYLMLIHTIRTIENSNLLQQDIDMVNEWCCINWLPLNVSKRPLMTFHRIKAPTIYKGQNVTLARLITCERFRCYIWQRFIVCLSHWFISCQVSSNFGFYDPQWQREFSSDTIKIVQCLKFVIRVKQK